MNNIYSKNENTRKTSKLHIGLKAETYSKRCADTIIFLHALLFVVNKTDSSDIIVNQ